MRLDRRTFLQQAALTLVSVGVSETGLNLLSKNSRFASWLKPYVETLAQTTNRKLALLVGINDYSAKAHLHGCINDVELQKNLLIHRFGFLPQDIYTLTDRQATRENIETAFIEHLKEQANGDDVVLFHFSGYGSQVVMSDGEVSNSLIPIDASIPNKGKPAENDLLVSTLDYLGRSLNTNNLITVLDTSFQTTEEVLQGNFRLRSYDKKALRPSPEELAFQAQVQRNLPPKGIDKVFDSTIVPGIVLSAAEQNQVALEGTWNNFSAGLLTYALTKYLWQTTPKSKIQVALQQTVNNVNVWSEKQQQPKIEGKIESELVKNIATSQPAVGLITGADSKGVMSIQLTALPYVLLDAYRDESCFTVANSDLTPVFLQLRSREGITGKAQLIDSEPASTLDKEALVNQPIQEAIRVLPHNIGLKVALDSHLERIERVDATSALANVPTVKAAATAGEGYADCLLGKISLMVEKKAENEPHTLENPAHSYGLYTPRGKLIANTSGEVNEVVKTAVNRLEEYFKRLLATKWLELIINDNSSTIPLSASLELANKKSSLQKQTSSTSGIKPELTSEVPTIERGTEIILNIDNQSDRDLYSIIVGVDSNKSFITLYAPQESTEINTTPLLSDLKVSAHSELNIPQSKSVWKWKVSQPFGIATMYLITSVKPFKNALNLIAQQSTTKLDELQIIDVANSLEVVRAILQDIHLSSNDLSQVATFSNDVYALNVDNWLGLKFTYEVI